MSDFAFARWIRAVALGWLLGLVVLIVLAMFWGLTGLESQWMVGVGMGAGVGYMQARDLTATKVPVRPWIIGTTVAMGVPFVLWDLGHAIGVRIVPSLPVAVGIGSVLVGVVQARMLRARPAHMAAWIVANFVGWCIPVVIIASADPAARGASGALVSTLVMFIGGIFLGVATVFPLGRIAPSVREAGR